MEMQLFNFTGIAALAEVDSQTRSLYSQGNLTVRKVMALGTCFKPVDFKTFRPFSSAA